jgi:hypothetical protein
MPIRVVLVQTFWSQAALVDWMLGTPTHADDLLAGDGEVDAAPNRAHATCRWDPFLNSRRFVLVRECS